MKKQLFLIGILCLLFTSCNDTVIDPKEPIEEDTTTYPDCPHYDYNKYYEPVYDDLFSISLDGKYAVIRKHFDGKSVITVADRFLLNLQTGEYILVGGNENGKLGGTGRAFEFDTLQFPEYNRILVFGRFSFCPYNSNIINILARCDIDTIGDKKNLYSFYNYFTYNIQTLKMEKITPSIFGKWGIRHQNGIQLVSQWLSTSSEGNDKFLIIHPNKITYIYHLQEDRLEETNSNKDLTNTIISGDGQFRFYKSGNGNWKEPYLLYLNDKEVFLEDSMLVKAIGIGSFSKDK